MIHRTKFNFIQTLISLSGVGAIVFAFFFVVDETSFGEQRREISRPRNQQETPPIFPDTCPSIFPLVFLTSPSGERELNISPLQSKQIRNLRKEFEMALDRIERKYEADTPAGRESVDILDRVADVAEKLFAPKLRVLLTESQKQRIEQLRWQAAGVLGFYQAKSTGLSDYLQFTQNQENQIAELLEDYLENPWAEDDKDSQESLNQQKESEPLKPDEKGARNREGEITEKVRKCLTREQLERINFLYGKPYDFAPYIRDRVPFFIAGWNLTGG